MKPLALRERVGVRVIFWPNQWLITPFLDLTLALS